jgi:N utilization substance protein B
MSARRKGRILAFQTLYSWEALCRASGGVSGRARKAIPSQAGEAAPGLPETPESPEGGERLRELLQFSWLETRCDPEILDFSRLLIQGTIESIGEVDAMIRSHLQNWDFSRIKEVDLAILRISTYALMHRQAAPSIIMSEAIGICREYGTDESFRFVNGILDGIQRTLRKKASPAVQECAAGSGQK